MDFSLIEYTLWVMVAFWSLVLIDNVYAKTAGGLLLLLAVVRALLEPNSPAGGRGGGSKSAPPEPEASQGDSTGSDQGRKGSPNVF